MYCVTSKNGGTLTDATGTLSEPIEAGKQLHVTAPSDMLLIDDEEAILRPANFNKARLALRMLGAGEIWPADYTRLLFIQNTGKQYVNTGWKATPDTGCRIEVQAETSSAFSIPCGEGEGFVPLMTTRRIVGYATTATQYPLLDGTVVTGATAAEASGMECVNEGRITVELNFFGSGRWRYRDAGNAIDVPVVGLKSTANPLYLTARNYRNQNQSGTYFYFWSSPFYRAAFTEGRTLTHDYRPALNSSGRPCLLDVVTGEAVYNSGTGEYIVGVATVAALAQLLKRLPAGEGGSLTLSLPADANTPEVAEQLQACQEQTGMTLTVYEYRPAAVTTYALRRVRQAVWCRMAENTDGSYVSDGGERFEIDRCAAIYGPLGSDPTAYGYEPFDSVEDAAAWFGLTPYEYHEEEII